MRTVAPSAPASPPRIEYLKVRNFRALRSVEFKKLTPLTALLGPNGSGKSTVFDVFAFLAECFDSGLRRAWDRRGRALELKTRGSRDPVAIERILKRHGYFTTGLRKIEAARAVATHIAADRNRSRSFAHFRDAIAEAVA